MPRADGNRTGGPWASPAGRPSAGPSDSPQADVRRCGEFSSRNASGFAITRLGGLVKLHLPEISSKTASFDRSRMSRMLHALLALLAIATRQDLAARSRISRKRTACCGNV